MSRKLRVLQSHYPYYITTRTNNREFRFNRTKDEKEVAKIFADVVLAACKKYGVTVYHCILMPDHHYLVCDTPKANLSRFMQYINARFAERINKLQRTTGHVWGERFASMIIESDQHLKRVLQHLYHDPVRAELTTSAIDYENSSIGFYAFGRPSFVQVTPDGLFLSMGATDEERQTVFVRELVGIALTSEEMIELRSGFRSGFYGYAAFVGCFKGTYDTRSPST